MIALVDAAMCGVLLLDFIIAFQLIVNLNRYSQSKPCSHTVHYSNYCITILSLHVYIYIISGPYYHVSTVIRLPIKCICSIIFTIHN